MRLLSLRNSMPRFTVRKIPRGWMVWDTVTRTIAVVDDQPAIGIAAETANSFADLLNAQDKLAV
jgi:hypothetical protein